MRQNRLQRQQQQQQQQGSISSPLVLAPSIAAVSTATAASNQHQQLLNREREALVQAHLAASAAVASNCLAASSAAAMATSAASSPVKLRPAWSPSPSSSQHASPVRPMSFASTAEDDEPIHAKLSSPAHNHLQPLQPPLLSVEEQEQHSVQQLLRQQALRLILEQVQVRANKRARRNVFSRWIWRWKIK
jgi:hypothetical protein